MERVPTPAEVFKPKADQTYIQTSTTSALSSAALEQFASYPNSLHSLEGIDIETGNLVTAALSKAGKEYACKTCRDPIYIDEENVIVSGIISVRARDGFVHEYHHMHTECFQNFELRFWYSIRPIARAITTAIAKQNGWRKPALVAA